MKNPENEPVVAVCGNEARTYGALENGRRPLLSVKVFPHYGAAKYYAQSFEDAGIN